MKHWEADSVTYIKMGFGLYKECHIGALANGNLCWYFS